MVYNYVSALNVTGKPSLKISNDYLKSNPDISKEQLSRFLFAATVDADSKIFDKMVANKNTIVTLETEKKYNNRVKSDCDKRLRRSTDSTSNTSPAFDSSIEEDEDEESGDRSNKRDGLGSTGTSPFEEEVRSSNKYMVYIIQLISRFLVENYKIIYE